MKLLDAVLTFLDHSALAEWELIVIASAICAVAMMVGAVGVLAFLA